MEKQAQAFGCESRHTNTKSHTQADTRTWHGGIYTEGCKKPGMATHTRRGPARGASWAQGQRWKSRWWSPERAERTHTSSPAGAEGYSGWFPLRDEGHVQNDRQKERQKIKRRNRQERHRPTHRTVVVTAAMKNVCWIQLNKHHKHVFACNEFFTQVYQRFCDQRLSKITFWGCKRLTQQCR